MGQGERMEHFRDTAPCLCLRCRTLAVLHSAVNAGERMAGMAAPGLSKEEIAISCQPLLLGTPASS